MSFLYYFGQVACPRRNEGETNQMDYAKESLRLHTQWKGKIEIQARVPVETKDDLSTT